MITFEGQLSGTQIANKLMEDTEELFYCLEEMADSSNNIDYMELAEFFSTAEDKQKIINFLRNTAGILEAM